MGVTLYCRVQVLQENGYVGIGIVNPSQQLAVAGGVRLLKGDSSPNCGLTFADGTGLYASDGWSFVVFCLYL